MPLALLVLVLQALRRRTSVSQELYFLVFCGFGVILFLCQYRLHVFGSAILYLAPLYAARQTWLQSRPGVKPSMLLAIAIVVAHVPSLGMLVAPQPAGMDPDLAMQRDVFRGLAAACKRYPGAVLAQSMDGHYLRFFTECAVASNNFRMTPQDVERARTAEALLKAPVEHIIATAPWIDYIYVRVLKRDQDMGSFGDPDIRTRLLEPGYRGDSRLTLLAESSVQATVGGRDYVASRAFRINRP
jgi:hypothetical protein